MCGLQDTTSLLPMDAVVEIMLLLLMLLDDDVLYKELYEYKLIDDVYKILWIELQDQCSNHQRRYILFAFWFSVREISKFNKFSR